MYLWERPRWPSLTWEERSLSNLLAAVSREQGRLLGRMEALGFDLRDEAHLQTLTDDVVKTSEIEGEQLDRDQVRSSIARRLGLDVGGLVPADREVEGVVEMMLALKVFELPYAATSGGPVNASRTLVMHIYETAFQWNRMDEAAVASIALFVLILIITVVQHRLLSRQIRY